MKAVIAILVMIVWLIFMGYTGFVVLPKLVGQEQSSLCQENAGQYEVNPLYINDSNQ